MKVEELTPWLFRRTTGGIRWGLDRTLELLAGVGDPHRHFHSVHIGGTNGKGSVAALAEAVLRAKRGGAKVGLYTSPHLVDFSERIRIDGRPAPDEAIVEAAARLRPAIERTGATFFEATTAIAFQCFAAAEVEVAVVEVGLGGRLDSTNVLEPLVAGVTNVGLDHMEYLGGTLAEIAAEKAGIFKAGVPAVTTEWQPEGLAALRSVAQRVGAPLSAIDPRQAISDLSTSAKGTRFHASSRTWSAGTYFVRMAGSHQATNALLAMELLGRLPPEYRPTLGELDEGFGSALWPGRAQVERIGSTTWVFDVAHNPAGVSALARTVAELDLPAPIVLVVSILADKPWRAMLDELCAFADAVILTSAPSAPVARRWDLTEVTRSAAAAPNLRTIPDLTDALSRATTLAPHGTVLVTGSVHTVGDTLAILGISTV